MFVYLFKPSFLLTEATKKLQKMASIRIINSLCSTQMAQLNFILAKTLFYKSA